MPRFDRLVENRSAVYDVVYTSLEETAIREFQGCHNNETEAFSR